MFRGMDTSHAPADKLALQEFRANTFHRILISELNIKDDEEKQQEQFATFFVHELEKSRSEIRIPILKFLQQKVSGSESEKNERILNSVGLGESKLGLLTKRMFLKDTIVDSTIDSE